MKSNPYLNQLHGSPNLQNQETAVGEEKPKHARIFRFPTPNTEIHKLGGCTENRKKKLGSIYGCTEREA